MLSTAQPLPFQGQCLPTCPDFSCSIKEISQHLFLQATAPSTLSFPAKLLQRGAHILSPSFPHSHPHHCNLASAPLKLLQPNPFSSHFTLPCKALKIIARALEKLPSLASTVLLLAVMPFTSFYDSSLTPLLLLTPWCSHLILTSLLLFHSELCSLPK